ncbi:sel1 repeat family protein [Thalassotalea sp. M1531]|uniref:Sel1 repeat family protein n=1 Tax=Thalassotalea algicola TaxID=2716224 RepID=A0A7Y0LFD0_9GAMM|nr:tetratricopeptide repeat protein [Thalassotalea algicola]NMP33202.1 sel1 repeat family protein [Thalassotalea algicola]
MKMFNHVILLIGVLLLSTLVFPSAAATLPSNCQSELCKNYFNDFRIAAKRGHPQAMSTLGQFYYHAYGTEKNINEALKYFKRASRLGGDSAAQLKAGIIYISEESHKDIEQGIKYLKKAAKKDYKAANFVLGMIYFDESFGKQEFQLADKYLAAAYKQRYKEVAKIALFIKQDDEIPAKFFPKLLAAMNAVPLLESANGNITWPQDEVEVITVTSPPLETVLREQLVTYRRPIKTTGTRFTGKSCAERTSCYASDGVEGMADYSFLTISYNRAASGQ